MSEHFYRPADGHRLPHDPFNSIVAPRPIGWIATLDAQGRRNLAPYSFFNALNYTPPLVGFSSNGWKGTVASAEATREFTWNLATRSLAERMNATSTTDDVDEFEAAGLEAAASREIDAPRVAAAPVTFECRVTQVIELQTATGEASGSWFTAARWSACTSTRTCWWTASTTARAQPIMRAGGPTAYFGIDTSNWFDMRRPQ